MAAGNSRCSLQAAARPRVARRSCTCSKNTGKQKGKQHEQLVRVQGSEMFCRQQQGREWHDAPAPAAHQDSRMSTKYKTSAGTGSGFRVSLMPCPLDHLTNPLHHKAKWAEKKRTNKKRPAQTIMVMVVLFGCPTCDVDCLVRLFSSI